MQVEFIRPHRALADFIYYYATYEFTVSQPVQRVLCAKNTAGLLFAFRQPAITHFNLAGHPTYTRTIFDGPALQGPSSTYGTGYWQGECNCVVAVLRPVGAALFLRAPANLITNCNYSFDDLHLGPAFAELQDKLWAVTTGRAAVALIEPYLWRHFARSARRFRENDVGAVARFIEQERGVVSIEKTAQRFRISRRGLEKQFLPQIGHTPKMFARLCRFRALLRDILRNPNLSWLDVVAAYEYTDQAHFIRDFQDFAGQSPRQFFLEHPATERMAREERGVFAFLQ